MSTQILTELPNIQYTGMDFEAVLAELQNIINNNPNWRENWTGFYSSEAGQMFLQLMAWVCDNLSTRQDVLLNESFLSTANKTKNKIRLLKQIGYQPDLAHSAQAALTIELNSVPEENVVITPEYSITSSLALRANRIARFSSEDINGETIVWEILPLVNGEPDYLGGVILKSGSTSYTTDKNDNTIYAVQGETQYKEFSASTADGPFVDLEESNIAADSIVVYTKSNAKKCQKVNSFVSTEAMDSSYPIPYIISVNDNGTLRIKFANKDTLADDRLLAAGTDISIFYRTTSGASGNISAEVINTTSYFVTYVNQTPIQGSIKNEIAAYNGTNAEELDSAVLNAPLTLRTLDRAVTVEDYDILLKKNANLLKAKTYSAANNPNDFYGLYGRFINPQEAFIFAIVNHDYSKIPSKEYNNFPWISLYKVPRLNEKYSFNNGENNVPVSMSETYYNLTLFENGKDARKFNNATILNIGSAFNEAVLENLDNGAFQLKISKETVDNVYFANIPYSLVTDSGYAKFYLTDLIDNREIVVDDNARFISQSSYKKEDTSDFVIDCIDIMNARYIIMALDNRTEMVIDLWENFEEGLPEEHYYVLWDNVPEGDLAPATDKRIQACYQRHGILQLVNSQIVAISNGSTSQSEAANVYTSNNAYQWFGLNVADPDNTAFIFDNPDYLRKDLIFTINNVTFKFPFSPKEGKDAISYKEIVEQLNEHFQNSDVVRVYEGGFWVTVKDNQTYDFSSLKADIVQTTNYTEGSYSYSYDMFIKTENKDWISEDGYITVSYQAVNADEMSPDVYGDVEYNGEYESFIHVVHNRDVVVDYKNLIGSRIKAVSYNNLAMLLDDPTNKEAAFFAIFSPMTGKDSSIQFMTDDIIEEGCGNFMRDFLGVTFNAQNASQKIVGQKKIYILTSTAEAGYKEDDNEPEYTNLPSSLSAGNLIFENSCMYNNYDFSNLYAFYKIADSNSIEIGSKYENFYYTGDEEIDNSLKDKLVYLTGTVLDEDGNVDVLNSNFEIKMTKKPVETNSFYAIVDDLGVRPCDRVEITTVNISKEFPNSAISFTLDNISSDNIIDVNLMGLSNGPDVVKAIQEAIIANDTLGDDEENIYQDYIDNINDVVSVSYDCLNQVVLRGLNKNNGNITFWYPGKFEEDDIRRTHQYLFGTSRTNTSFYKIYPPNLFAEENIVGLDEEGNFTDISYDEDGNIINEYFYYPAKGYPLVFDYRYLDVDGSGNIVSKTGDYYITYEPNDNRFYLVKTQDSLFPSTDFYLHFINDRSSEDFECDEKLINEYMNDKKISGMDLYLAKPYFRGYDIKAIVYYNANYSESTIKNAVETAVSRLCNIKNAEIGGYMSQAKIIKEVMACDGVENIAISFFGYDSTSGEASQIQLDAKFFEILHINDFEEGKHGILFNYELQG